MPRERLNEFQKRIIRIYQDTSKQKRGGDFSLSRQEVTKLFFRRSPGENLRSKPFQLKEKNETDKVFDERKLPYKLETEKQAWARRAKEAERPLDDWRERVGLGNRLRGIYSKKQEVLNRGLRDLTKKGYLEKSGSGIRSSYRITEKALKTKLPKF